VREALTKLADFASNMEDTVGNCIASYEILEYIEAAYPALPAVAPAPVAGATHAELVELLSEFENGDYQYDSLATEILSRFAHPAVAPAPRAWTDAQCVAAMREFSAQKGESHDAVWGQIDEQLKHEIIGEWRAILECAVAASAPPHRNGGT
jgi:glutathione S-transferase